MVATATESARSTRPTATALKPIELSGRHASTPQELVVAQSRILAAYGDQSEISGYLGNKPWNAANITADSINEHRAKLYAASSYIKKHVMKVELPNEVIANNQITKTDPAGYYTQEVDSHVLKAIEGRMHLALGNTGLNGLGMPSRNLFGAATQGEGMALANGIGVLGGNGIMNAMHGIGTGLGRSRLGRSGGGNPGNAHSASGGSFPARPAGSTGRSGLAASPGDQLNNRAALEKAGFVTAANAAERNRLVKNGTYVDVSRLDHVIAKAGPGTTFVDHRLTDWVQAIGKRYSELHAAQHGRPQTLRVTDADRTPEEARRYGSNYRTTSHAVAAGVDFSMRGSDGRPIDTRIMDTVMNEFIGYGAIAVDSSNHGTAPHYHLSFQPLVAVARAEGIVPGLSTRVAADTQSPSTGKATGPS